MRKGFQHQWIKTMVLLLLIESMTYRIHGQNIQIVANPTAAPPVFSWTGSGALSGYTGAPVVLNNSIVLEYSNSGTSDLAQIKQQLAVYNGGDSLHLVTNPDNGQGVYFQSVQIIFNNKLFFIYNSASGSQQLASFDGNAITIYPNPDASASGFIGSPRVLNNTLYVAYQNVSGVTQLARFNGSGLTLIPNPDNSTAGYFNNYSAVFNNKIVSRYVTAAGPKQLAVFDGTQWTVLPNPDNTPNRGVQPVFPTLYHNKLYFVYLSATGQYQLLQYDGVNNPVLIANPQNSSANGGGPTITDGMSIVYNDTLFFQYYDVNNVYRLAKFGGSSITLVPNPDATPYGYWWQPVIYNNGLYILYQTADAKRHLARYMAENGNIGIIANPDAGTGYIDQPVVYGNRLYIKYKDVQSIFRLAEYDGSALGLVPNPPGVYGTGVNDGYMGAPVVWNEKLFLQFGSVPYRHAGNLAYYAAASNGICAGTNTSFTSNINGTSYQWQADNGSGSFVNLSNTAPFSNVTSGSLTLTAPATSLYGYKFRCLVNNSNYSNVFTLKFSSSWSGAVSNAWETAGNWSCGNIPDGNTDVYIASGKPNYPLVNSTRQVRSVHTENGTGITIAAGKQLTVTGRQ